MGGRWNPKRPLLQPNPLLFLEVPFSHVALEPVLFAIEAAISVHEDSGVFMLGSSTCYIHLELLIETTLEYCISSKNLAPLII